MVLGVTRIPDSEISLSGYDCDTMDKLLRMMKEKKPDARIDAINVADGISNLLSMDGLKAGPNNFFDERMKSIQNSELYVKPAASRLDNTFGLDGNFRFYDFVVLLIQRGRTSI